MDSHPESRNSHLFRTRKFATKSENHYEISRLLKEVLRQNREFSEKIPRKYPVLAIAYTSLIVNTALEMVIQGNTLECWTTLNTADPALHGQILKQS